MMQRATLTICTLLILGASVPAALATTDCAFTVVGTTMYLDDDCTTDATLLIPDGYTLDGKGHLITAVDPVGGFKGAVVANAGSTAHVTHLAITSSNLGNSCKNGADRLRGILFDGAGGSITHCTIAGVNKGASGCQEGNAIEVRNAPFDGTHPGTVTVEVAYNDAIDWQKTGIIANGDVNVSVHHNKIYESATQANLAANSLQLGFGALGIATHNYVEGNQWQGWSPNSNFASAAVLVYLADVVNVSRNNVRGNSDVGLFIVSDFGVFDNNRVFDRGADLGGYDVGVWSYGDNVVKRNKVRGFDDPYLGVAAGGNNKVIPGPQIFK